MASRPGRVVAAGGHVNPKSLGSKSFPSAADGTKGVAAANCYQKFNRKEDVDVIHKTEAQLRALTELFHGHDPKLKPAQAREIMKKMIDPNNSGLMFCWSKRGTFCICQRLESTKLCMRPALYVEKSLVFAMIFYCQRQQFLLIQFACHSTKEEGKVNIKASTKRGNL
jgi:hypothetical protein